MQRATNNQKLIKIQQKINNGEKLTIEEKKYYKKNTVFLDNSKGRKGITF